MLLGVAPAVGLERPAPETASGLGAGSGSGGAYDSVVETGSLRNTTLITGARRLWREGITGRGVDVAVVDSGVSPVAGLDAPGKLLHGPDFSPDAGAAPAEADSFGHGTHMAGIIAGRDAPATGAADESDAFLGMAPDARVISVRAADARGDTDLPGVAAAVDWVVAHRDADGLRIRVLNLSFAADPAAAGVAPLTAAVERAWRAGIVVVAAVGNARGEPEPAVGLGAPALVRDVLAVGAADPRDTLDVGDETVAGLSRIAAPGAARTPDLVAPGVSIASLRVPGSYIDRVHGETGRASDRLFRGSGTSQAAAVVSGAVALLLQRRPDLAPDEVRELLRATARQLPGPAAAQGAGALNLEGVLARVDAASGPGAGVVPSGRSWSGRSWSGRSWSGRSWSGRSWSGRSWSGRSWSGRSWSGRSWSGRSWSGRSWSGRSWSGRSWSSAGWG